MKRLVACGAGTVVTASVVSMNLLMLCRLLYEQWMNAVFTRACSCVRDSVSSPSTPLLNAGAAAPSQELETAPAPAPEPETETEPGAAHTVCETMEPPTCTESMKSRPASPEPRALLPLQSNEDGQGQAQRPFVSRPASPHTLLQGAE